MTHERSPDGRFLIAAPTGRDAKLACSVLLRADIDALACGGIDELCREAGRGCAGLLLAEEVLVPTTVQRLKELVAAQEPWSDLPMLLFTGASATLPTRGPTAALLRQLGNVTLLERPLRPITMVSAVQAALRARQRQYEARTMMASMAEGLRQRDQFLAMLGHELRNPLGAILFGIDVLEHGGPERATKCYATIRRQTRHLARLVDDLLDVSRVTSGKIVLKRGPVDLAELLRRCVETLEPRAQEQHQRLDLDVDGEPAVLAGDEVRLEQIFTNLIGNALKYTPASGHIAVRLRRVDAEAIVSVTDDGSGIAADTLPHVFDLFTQAKPTLDRAQGGLGIGLTLVRTLVQLHGGSVEAASEGLGRGSEFTVRLPLVVQSESVVQPSPNRP
ncbi:MAG TPA: HAMP domain-containing sensor histidine kinase [Nannocystis sp.]